ncbi:MAG: radical SAM family heme chaperone HemW [Planctomycetales bacterium]|nr:radical SAM family heme chaperone HemW [Planctomycetales bacterium]
MSDPRRAAPRSVYVHVPFCRRRCGYCNFTLIAERPDLIDDYLTAIEREVDAWPQPLEIDTMHIGGGTPTQLNAQQWRRLWNILQARFHLARGAEFAVEANPADVDAAMADVLAELGVNRLSLGAQSFDDAKLERLERDHRAADVRRAVELARQRGVNDVSLDLMFAAPEETLPAWRSDLNAALALAPDHVSTYGLTIEKGAAFYGRLQRGRLTEAHEELQRSMYLAAIDALTAAGFEHYEVSNFARPGMRSRHNEAYWTMRPYLAFGPGAARFVDGRRETNHRSVATYLRRVLAGQSPVAESETLGPEDAARERLVFGLRRLEGIDLSEFAAQTGTSVERLAGAAVAKCVDLGLLEFCGNRLRLTQAGLLVSDAIWPELL